MRGSITQSAQRHSVEIGCSPEPIGSLSVFRGVGSSVTVLETHIVGKVLAAVLAALVLASSAGGRPFMATFSSVIS